MTEATIKILSKALNHLATRDIPPTMQEARMASDIMSSLDKITRLDEGNPTDIISDDKPLTITEVQKKIAKDPFAIPAVGYVEVENTTNEEN